ncbi:MAG: methyltransferase type 11 [candidate division NC10 bacterium CSP1-5]|nr:MAG: methyltransferase type 11 [candidate division NC10 bacterium CSP1-5]
MQPEVRQAIVGYFTDAKPGKILDIPSGNCWLFHELTSGAWEYFSADLFTNASIRNFQRADLNEPLAYDDDVFDYVACLEGLEHIENTHHALREFYRILKKDGILLISTPNPLNIKSRLRFLLFGTFYGFPHLVRMPAAGEHLHISPINLSFLISFAERYGFVLDRIHRVRITVKMYRFIIHCWMLKLYTLVKLLFKDHESRRVMERLVTLNVLLNDGIVVSLRKQ